jgi:hypothetical protein
MGARALDHAIPAIGFATLHRRELARDPWSWAVALLLPLAAWTWRQLAPEVGVMSVFGVAALLLPPAVLALTAPRLAVRTAWAFWGSLAVRPAAAYRGAVIGAVTGVLIPILAGTAAAAAVVGAPLVQAAALVAAVTIIVVTFGAVAGVAAAATLDPAKAVAIGAAVWGAAVIAYEPALVALAALFANRPYEPFLAALVLAHPIELARVALLRTLDIPVFVGPTGLLIGRWLGEAAALWAVAAAAVVAAAGTVAAGLVLARRER